jgi:hypothetical protein
MPPRSKIATLPDEMRQWLHQALVERAFGDIIPLTDELNAKLKEAGVAVYIGKSAVGAESQKLKRAQESIRAATEAAKHLAEGARDDKNLRGEAVMALIETEMFEAILSVREMADTDDPLEKMSAMSLVAKNIATLSRARVNQSKFRIEFEAKLKLEADAIAGIAKVNGLGDEAVNAIRERVLGISKAV